MNHPLHPMLVHLPVGLWTGSFVFDIAFMLSGGPSFATTSYYCMIAGLIGALLAIPPGFAEFVEIPRATLPKRIATTHLLLNAVVTVLFLLNFLSRRALEDGTPTLVTRGQFILSIFTMLLFVVSGFLGGLLAYNHGIGFKPQLRGRDKPETRRAA